MPSTNYKCFEGIRIKTKHDKCPAPAKIAENIKCYEGICKNSARQSMIQVPSEDSDRLSLQWLIKILHGTHIILHCISYSYLCINYDNQCALSMC